MKLLAALLTCAILQSCQVNNPGKKDKHTLYINTVVPAHKFLKISTENASTFSIDAVNKSSNTIALATDTSEIIMKKDKEYSLNIGQKGSVSIKKPSGQEVGVKLKVYNHSSKIIQHMDNL
ncbi:hypothetical protein [Sphingobacterium detergens]